MVIDLDVGGWALDSGKHSFISSFTHFELGEVLTEMS